MRKMKTRRFILVLMALATLALAACAPTEAASGEIYIEDVQILILESFPVQVRAVVSGNLPDGCTEIRAVRVSRGTDPQTFNVEFETERDPNAMCTQALVPFEESVALEVEGLEAGTYTVDVHGETATFTLDVDNVAPEG